MKKSKLIETLRNIIKRELKENSTAPSKPETRPGPAIHPGKPGTDKPKPRRPLGNPEIKPKPKASLNEEDEIINKIVKRFQSEK